MLGLGVVLVVFGGVLLGGEGHVQGDLDLPHLRVIEIRGDQPGLSPLNAVEVGADDVPQLPQTLPVVGGLQLLFLIAQLPAHPGELIAQGLVHGLGAGPHPLRQRPAGVEVVQQRREAGEGGLGHIALILADGPEGVVLPLPVQIQAAGRKVPLQAQQLPQQSRGQG